MPPFVAHTTDRVTRQPALLGSITVLDIDVLHNLHLMEGVLVSESINLM